jgi:uncharacterized protein YqfA (UPF0365 family)
VPTWIQFLGAVGTALAVSVAAFRLFSQRLETRVEKLEEAVAKADKEASACAADRRSLEVAYAGMRSDVDHTRANVARALAKDG